MNDEKIADKIFGLNEWILIPGLGLCYYLFKNIQKLDFSSPYLNDWIFISILVWVFYIFVTICGILSLSTYFKIKSIANSATGNKTNGIAKNITISKELFSMAFEFFNLGIILAILCTSFLILLYFVCPFVYFDNESKENNFIYGVIATACIFLPIIAWVGKSRLGSFFKKMYDDCVILIKKYRNYWMLYLAVLSLIFPFFCYRFDLSINNEIFNKNDKTPLIIDIIASGMTSSSSYYNHLTTHILLVEESNDKIPLEFKKIDKKKFQAVINISNLPVGTFIVKSYYKRQLMCFIWNISRERIFRII